MLENRLQGSSLIFILIIRSLLVSCFEGHRVFSSLQASLGGRVRLMITGAAPVSPTILTFLRAALGCQVSQTDINLAGLTAFKKIKSVSVTVEYSINVTANINAFYSFMKVMARLNVQLGARCQCLETGQQVNVHFHTPRIYLWMKKVSTG